MVAFGMQLPIQSQSTIFVQPWEPAAGVAELVQVTQACEAAGFDYVAVCDHVAIPAAQAEAMSTTWWDTVATLSYLAAVTERVRLLSHVYVLPVPPPAGGGQGVGHPRPALGRPGDPRRRAPGTSKASSTRSACRSPTAGGCSTRPSTPCGPRSPTSSRRTDGERWQFDDVGQRPRPVQATVPIWVGGSSKPAMRRAAERGDGWLPQGPPEGGMAAGIDFVRAHRAATRGDDPIVLGALSGPLYVGDPDWETPRCVRGSADKIAGYLRTYAELGVDQIQVGFVSRSADELCDQIAAFAADVAPLVND